MENLTYETATSTATQDNVARGVALSSDGTRLFVLGNQNQQVYRYDLATPWSVASASYAHATSVAVVGSNLNGLRFSDDGTNMYVNDYTADRIAQFTLSAPWDITTASFYASSSNFYNEYSFAFGNNGTDLYTANIHDRGGVRYYTLGTPWDISTVSAQVAAYKLRNMGFPRAVYISPDGKKPPSTR